MEWKSSHTFSVSTVKRIPRKYGLIGRIAAKKSLLNERHVSSCLKWCKAYTMLDPCFWNDVIFPDKCRIEPFSRRIEYVRRLQGFRYTPKYTTKLWNLEVAVWSFEEPSKKMTPESSYDVRVGWIPLLTKRYWRNYCCQCTTYKIYLNRMELHAINQDWSLLFWTRQRYVCSVIGRISHQI